MAAEDVDAYLRGLEEPKRRTLEALRPFSGSVLSQLGDELDGYTMTKSALHFPVDRPLPKALVEKLIAVRLGETRKKQT